MDTNLSLQSNKSDKGLINSLKALRNTIIDLKLLQDGDTILLPQRKQRLVVNLELGFVEIIHHPELNSDCAFSLIVPVVSLRLLEI